jgi:SET domain-containing protein
MAKSPFHCNKVRVLPAGAKGRGVFAKGDLVEGEVIEFAPVIVLDRDEGRILLKTALGSHAFDLGRNRVGVALGYGSLYNHSKTHNAEFESSPDGIRIIALRHIRADEEITLNYRWTDAELAGNGIPRDA